MQRVVVVGPSAAGKSTLARRLGVITGLPVVHIDRMLWRPGWVEASREEFDAAHAAAVAEDRWILDGTYLRTLPQRLERADAIVWLDFPRSVSLRRVMWRTIRYLGRTRPDMTAGCNERFDLEFLSYIWSFQTRQRPGLARAIASYGGHARLHLIRSPREARRFLSSLQ